MPTLIAVLTVCALIASPARAQSGRPVVGVAFGGGSARGLAHVGVLQWFEEHHIPIDIAAGTSMGGLIGGAFAIGMSATELRALVDGIDWDTMFGSSTFRYQSIRRKEDARSYPSRLEFGVKHGIVPPTSLNDGRQVDLLLARLAGPYYQLKRFDELPTPFRVVAVDLTTGDKAVLEDGSLATALRATMSLPAIFPPVDRDGRVLVDGGFLDNVPADVVKHAGAAVVIAVDVGGMAGTAVDYSMFQLLGDAVDATMRAATREALADADLTISVDVTGFDSLDWRRADELIARGYEAAERRREDLLRYQLSDPEWQGWLAAREARRKVVIPQPSFLTTAGIRPADVVVVRRKLAHHLDVPLDVPALEHDLTALSGLDRYQSLTWRMVGEGDRAGLLVIGHEKRYAPPFLMLGFAIENATSQDFSVDVGARYLTFDTVGAGSELRLDGQLGTDPSATAALYKPLGGSAFFVRSAAGARAQTFDLVSGDSVIATYRERHLWADGGLGVNLSTDSELSGGVVVTRLNDAVRTGNPGLPDVSGREIGAHLLWVVDRQDSPVVPAHGTRAVAALSQTLSAPEVPGITRTNQNLTQAELHVSSFFSPGRAARNRLFVVLSGGTSFDDRPLPTRQFTLGYPFVLDAFRVGERRGDHYGVVTLGGARQVARLPDFLGGPVFAGAWLENGAAFDSHADVDVNTQVGFGVIADTLVGPVMIAGSAGVTGGWRTMFGVGRIFR